MLLNLSLLLPLLCLAETTPLTISTSVDMALTKNPDVLKAREFINGSDESYVFAKTKALPTIAATIQAQYLKAQTNTTSPLFGGEPYNQYIAQLTLQQPLYDAAIFAGLGYSKKDINIKKFQLQVAERTLTESVLETFYTVILNEKLIRILEDSLKVYRETLATAERYYRIGRAQKIDVLQLKTQIALLDSKIANADAVFRDSAALLATYLRILDTGKIKMKGALSAPTKEWVLETRKKYNNQLPEVSAARETIDQFADNKSVQLASYDPKLSLTGQWGRSVYKKVDFTDSHTTSWAMALVLNVPIFNGLGSVYQKKVLSSQETQLVLDEVKTTDTVAVNVIQSMKNLESANSQMESAKKASDFGKESLQEAKIQYARQLINYLQYQSSQQAYLDAETQYTQAKYNYIVSIAKYFNSVGVPLSELVGKLENLDKAQ